MELSGQKNRAFPLWLKVGLVVMLLTILGGVSCVGWVGWHLLTGQWFGSNYETSDFSSDSERIAFLQQFSPVVLPATATQVELNYLGGGPDDYCEASFVLTAAELQPFELLLSGWDHPEPDVYETKVGSAKNYPFVFTIDRSTGRVELKYHQM